VIALAAALWLSQPVAPPPQSPAPWRVVSTHALHVGVRAHFIATPGETAAALTVQFTFLHVL
jgi:hypothetical protein